MVKNLIEKFNALILLAIFLLTMLAVVFRTVLEIPASWSEELSQFGFIFLVFIGAAAATADDSHIKITSFVDRLPAGGQRLCRLLQVVLPIPFFIAFAVGAWTNVEMNWTVELSTVAWMTVGYMYLVVLISSLLMLLFLSMRLVRELRGVAGAAALPARAHSESGR